MSNCFLFVLTKNLEQELIKRQKKMKYIFQIQDYNQKYCNNFLQLNEI